MGQLIYRKECIACSNSHNVCVINKILNMKIADFAKSLHQVRFFALVSLAVDSVVPLVSLMISVSFLADLPFALPLPDLPFAKDAACLEEGPTYAVLSGSK